MKRRIPSSPYLARQLHANLAGRFPLCTRLAGGGRRKRRYPDEDTADYAKDLSAAANPGECPQRHYECEHCGGWHLTKADEIPAELAEAARKRRAAKRRRNRRNRQQREAAERNGS